MFCFQTLMTEARMSSFLAMEPIIARDCNMWEMMKILLLDILSKFLSNSLSQFACVLKYELRLKKTTYPLLWLFGLDPFFSRRTNTGAPLLRAPFRTELLSGSV